MMMSDEFYKWYSEYNPDLDPDSDDTLDELFDCWKTAWNRSLELDEALTELARMAEEAGEYD